MQKVKSTTQDTNLHKTSRSRSSSDSPSEALIRDDYIKTATFGLVITVKVGNPHQS